MEQSRKTEPGEPRTPGKTGMPPGRVWMVFAIALLVNFLLVRTFFPSPRAITVPYTAFKEEVAKHNVASIYSKGESIEGRFVSPVTWPPETKAKDEQREREREDPPAWIALAAEPRTAGNS